MKILYSTSPRWRSAVTGVLCLVTVLACGAATPSNSRYRPGRFEFDWPGHAALTPELRRSVNERLSLDTELLVVKLQDTAVTGAVARANSRPALSPGSVMQLEKEWSKANAQTHFVVSKTDTSCGRSLELLIGQHSDFMEILVTDSRGLIVCQSRMTERYYQGDETWWRECVEGGRLSHSRVEYDEPSDALALSIFAPVLDPSTSQPIGVARALLRRHAGSR